MSIFKSRSRDSIFVGRQIDSPSQTKKFENKRVQYIVGGRIGSFYNKLFGKISFGTDTNKMEGIFKVIKS
jgi:hypothetical protein